MSFLRATALGLDLAESWIVCSAGAYVWNYYNHKLQKGRENDIVHALQTVLDGLKRLGHSGYVYILFIRSLLNNSPCKLYAYMPQAVIPLFFLV